MSKSCRDLKCENTKSKRVKSIDDHKVADGKAEASHFRAQQKSETENENEQKARAFIPHS
jgi:hypothetical protein